MQNEVCQKDKRAAARHLNMEHVRWTLLKFDGRTDRPHKAIALANYTEKEMEKVVEEFVAWGNYININSKSWEHCYM